MNIIRTKAVELSSIPAIAYKQKLSSGGAGIKVFRLDGGAYAVFTLDRRTGEAIPYGPVSEELFPADAVDEALELLTGLPYSGRGKIKFAASEKADAEDITEQEAASPAKASMAESDEYKAIVERYSDENGKINLALLNKDFMQFAAKSKVVAEMTQANAQAEAITAFILKNRAAFFAGKKEHLDDAATAALAETLEELSSRGVFKELKAYVIRALAKNKRK